MLLWFWRWIKIYVFGELYLNYLEECEEEQMKTAEDFQRGIQNFLVNIKENDGKFVKKPKKKIFVDLETSKKNAALDREKMKEKMDRMQGDTSKLLKNIL
jgi:hypothetical protein